LGTAFSLCRAMGSVSAGMTRERGETMLRQTRPDAGERAGPSEELSRRIGALSAIAQELGAILEQVHPDKAGAMVRIVRVQVDLERAVAPAAGGDIDFDAVRHEIGCRLARLRECCRSD
jgi:hypothetical protein